MITVDEKLIALVKQQKNFFLKYNSNLIFLSHKTGKKAGEFVSIWKKNNFNKNVPYEEKDNFTFMVIIFSHEKEYLILEKNILKEKNILTSSIGIGKLGMRVYSSLCDLDTENAQKTATWQKYFLRKIY